MVLRSFLDLTSLGLALAGGFARAAASHPLSLDDISKLQSVGNPVCSPDGQWIVYGVTTTDIDAD